MTTTGVRRKLTAILSADVKGYSLLMAEDDEATVHTLTTYREVMASLIHQFRGRVVDTPGDNLLAEFASVVDAVQCAVEIQRVLKAKNTELPENRRMEFRIGVNLGDVIEEGDHIYGDGLSENIIASLSKIPEMIVSARNPTFAYKGKHVKVQQIGKELGVRHVLEGSVLKSGNRLRVNAQLVDAIKGQHLWTEQYELEIKDLLDLIDEITNEIVLELRVKLLDGESLRMLAKGTANPEAWRYVSQGLNAPFTKEGNLKAREFLDKAVEIDPKYSAAWAVFALTHIMDADAGWTDTKDKSYSKALQFTQKALELNDSRPLAHALLGAFHKGRGQYGKAIAEGEKAISLGPNNATVHSIVAMIYFDAGTPEETIKLAKKAMHLAPYYRPSNLVILALAYHKAGRYEEALETFKQALKRIRIGEFRDYLALLGVTLTCIELGRDDEARAYAAELFKIRPNLSLSAAANALRFYKDHSDLKRFWNTLRKTGIVPPIVSSAQEFRYKGTPTFSIMYPKGRTEKESLDPKWSEPIRLHKK